MPDVLTPPLTSPSAPAWLAPLDAVPDVRWSAAVRDADSGRLLAAHAADETLRTASVGKIFLLVEVARQFQSGRLDSVVPPELGRA